MSPSPGAADLDVNQSCVQPSEAWHGKGSNPKSCAVRNKANDRSALFVAHSLSAVTFTILQLSVLC